MNIYKFYIYAYLREDGTPYYIGKGFDNRAYNKHKKIPVPKDKSRIVFYQTNLLEDDSHRLEIKYIKLFGRKDLGTGILRNMTDGGEGSSGRKTPFKSRGPMTEEQKLKIKLSNIGKHNIPYGPMSEENKEKLRGPRGLMSEKAKENMRKPKSEEHKQNMRGPRGPHKKRLPLD